MRRLASGEATVGELAQPFSISFQAVSKHLQVLEHAGLVERSRRAQQRPCRLRLEPRVALRLARRLSTALGELLRSP